MPSKQQILEAIGAMARRLGRAPSKAEFIAHSGISPYFVLQWFRSWSDAVRAAGVRPYTLNARIESNAMLEDWGQAARRNRGNLPRHIYLRQGKYNPCTLAKRFGGWRRVPEAFRHFAKSKRKWADVVPLLPKDVPRAPAPKDAHWPAIDKPVCTILLKKTRHAPLKDRATCGNPMDFRGLRHEPVNEQGVVLLFGMLARELGYVIETVQMGFPDCEAKRQIGPDRWQRVNIEFEFESKNFRDHGHPLTGCDVIVCWRHNWTECPKHIEVVELSSVVKTLAGRED
jgi:hypothetical protein